MAAPNKILTIIGKVQRHWILHYIMYKDGRVMRNHYVTLFCITTSLNTQQFVTATVVKKCLVVFRYAILQFREDFLMNNIFNKFEIYFGKRNN